MPAAVKRIRFMDFMRAQSGSAGQGRGVRFPDTLLAGAWAPLPKTIYFTVK
jgi:hypothetical protein